MIFKCSCSAKSTNFLVETAPLGNNILESECCPVPKNRACVDQADGSPCQKFCRGQGCSAAEGAQCRQGRCKRGPHRPPVNSNWINPCIGVPNGTPCNKKCKGKRCKSTGGAKCSENFCVRGPA